MRKREIFLLLILFFLLCLAAKAAYDKRKYKDMLVIDHETLMLKSKYWRPTPEEVQIGAHDHMENFYCSNHRQTFTKACNEDAWNNIECNEKLIRRAKASKKLTPFEIGGIIRLYRTCVY